MNSDLGSREYWQDRWRDEPNTYKASWPDSFARRLELDFIVHNLPLNSNILEIGCGPFTLGESARLFYKISEAPSYHGLDSAASALDQARQESPLNAQFSVCDLEAPDLSLPAADVIISRRVIQNLSPAARARVFSLLPNYPHGILIEGSSAGLAALNTLRAKTGLPPLPQPPYNSYLTDDEEDLLYAFGARRLPFMSTYYEATRGKRQLLGWDTHDHFLAYYHTLLRNEGHYGPNVGFIW